MAIEVFNRYEKKYLLSDSVCGKIQSQLAEHMIPDTYNQSRETYTICNIYYDTPDNHLIRTSLQKPIYKEKLRLRSYGIPNLDSKVYVEIKRKFDGLVNKRRSALPLNEAYRFLATGEIPDIEYRTNPQVLAEIQYILEQYDLSPKTFLSYERKAFFGADNHDLRISFDTDITVRRSDLRLESGIYGEKLLTDNNWLMEIKTSQSMPMWLCRLLSEYQIYPTGFSKYGEAHKAALQSTKPQVVAFPQTRTYQSNFSNNSTIRSKNA